MMSTVIDGHVPNYVDSETRVPLLLGVQISFTAVAVAIVLLRLYTRKFIRHVLTVEDWTATVSLVCIASLQFLDIVGCNLTFEGFWGCVDYIVLSRYIFQRFVLSETILMFKAGVLGGTGLHYYDVPPGTDKSFAALVRLKLHLYCEIQGAKTFITQDIIHCPSTLSTHDPISPDFNFVVLPQQPRQAGETSLSWSHWYFHTIRHCVYSCGILTV